MTAQPDLDVVVYGAPAAQGSKHAMQHRHTGKIVMLESSKRARPWRQDIVDVLLDATAAGVLDGQWPCDGPVAVTLDFTMPKPASAPKRRRVWPDRRPDIDKLTRLGLDALTVAGVLTDDARVVELHARKVYVGDPGSQRAPGVAIALHRIVEATP